MFPNVRLLIAAVVASVVALSCGFAMFATFRVNHEPLSRLASGAAPLQLAAGNPIPSVAMPAPADSFGNRFPLNQADSRRRFSQRRRRPSPITTTASNRRAQLPAPRRPLLKPTPPNRRSPRRSRTAPAQAPDAKPDEVAVTPSEPPPAAPSEPAPAATETAAAGAAGRAGRARQASRAHGTSQPRTQS